jgi:hypothetical protein
MVKAADTEDKLPAAEESLPIGSPTKITEISYANKIRTKRE